MSRYRRLRETKERDMNGRIKPKPGDMVVLTAVPLGLLDGLPEEDHHAITAIVSFDDPFYVRTDGYSNTHSVWVPPAFIALFPESQK